MFVYLNPYGLNQQGTSASQLMWWMHITSQCTQWFVHHNTYLCPFELDGGVWCLQGGYHLLLEPLKHAEGHYCTSKDCPWIYITIYRSHVFWPWWRRRWRVPTAHLSPTCRHLRNNLLFAVGIRMVKLLNLWSEPASLILLYLSKLILFLNL